MMEAKTELERDVAELIVATLNLEIPADKIDPLAPLFGDAGLGLDSIDMLEMSLAISRKYGFQLRADSIDKTSVFASLRAFCRYIDQHRAR